MGGGSGELRGGAAVRRTGPAQCDVAAEAQCGTRIVHDEKIAELIVVRIVAGDALHFVPRVEL